MELNVDRELDSAENDPRITAEIRQEIRQLLELLPDDVVGELNAGTIDVHDPAFLAGLTDHVSRQALADPRRGNQLLGKLGKVKTLLRRALRDSHEDLETSTTIRRSDQRVGRNDPCPCGSGRKFKECCLQSGAR